MADRPSRRIPSREQIYIEYDPSPSHSPTTPLSPVFSDYSPPEYFEDGVLLRRLVVEVGEEPREVLNEEINHPGHAEVYEALADRSLNYSTRNYDSLPNALEIAQYEALSNLNNLDEISVDREENSVIMPVEAFANGVQMFRFRPASALLQSEDSSTSTVPAVDEPEEPEEVQVETEEQEPPAKVRRLTRDDDQDGETCPICLEAWDSSGEHRLTALKCGHLFGASCVRRWLRDQPSRQRACPSCKTPASTRDLRNIYARRLVAVDTAELTALKQENKWIQAEKQRVESDLEQARFDYRSCVAQLDMLRTVRLHGQSRASTWRFALEKNQEISPQGGCRVCSYNCRTYELYISQKSTNTLFPGYGVRRFGCFDFKVNQFIHLHSKPIRDIAYSQPRDLFVTASLDKTFRIVERGVATMSVELEDPLWSCCWDRLSPERLFVGGFRGVVHQYDLRHARAPLRSLAAPRDDTSQVVSLCSTEHGLLACSINSCWLWAPGPLPVWRARGLPVQGPFMPLCYDHVSARAAVACRPSGRARSRLVLCKLSRGQLFDVESTFSSSATAGHISRPCWLHAADSSWVAGYSESEQAIYLHGAAAGSRSMSLPAAEPVTDLCGFTLDTDTVLAALTDTKLRLYKAAPTI